MIKAILQNNLNNLQENVNRVCDKAAANVLINVLENTFTKMLIEIEKTQTIEKKN